MKITFLSALLFTVVGHAYPNVGDFAEYDLTVQSAQGTEHLKATVEILAFDQQSGEYQISRKVIYPDGQVEEDNRVADPEEVPSENDLDGILNQCVSLGGVMEKDNVANLNLDVCTVGSEEKGSQASFGKIPFGITKAYVVDEEGTSTRARLLSFKEGAH